MLASYMVWWLLAGRSSETVNSTQLFIDKENGPKTVKDVKLVLEEYWKRTKRWGSARVHYVISLVESQQCREEGKE
ncbi:hypothetical protein QN277_011222 [Acacia crassicarpa]|uniref:Uncharacterized protein n=1 Tax=Acacia crassicarpa TaxID=499986 RepID=A0AAE1TB98_9FABA|nr:hypothetical protein QN277_011222 [Acacia crassicarpa]